MSASLSHQSHPFYNNPLSDLELESSEGTVFRVDKTLLCGASEMISATLTCSGWNIIEVPFSNIGTTSTNTPPQPTRLPLPCTDDALEMVLATVMTPPGFELAVPTCTFDAARAFLQLSEYMQAPTAIKFARKTLYKAAESDPAQVLILASDRGHDADMAQQALQLLAKRGSSHHSFDRFRAMLDKLSPEYQLELLRHSLVYSEDHCGACFAFGFSMEWMWSPSSFDPKYRLVMT